MTTASKKVERRVCELVAPIVEELGLELVEVGYFRHSGRQMLRVFLERPGGITVDELQEASRRLEKNLEVEDILAGPYRLEVSSPGIDRPLKNPDDFRKRIGTAIKIKTFSPLPDGRRRLSGTLVEATEEGFVLETDEEKRLTLSYPDVSSAKPDLDWEALLRKTPSPKIRKNEKAG